jgi:hypothetical protein
VKTALGYSSFPLGYSNGTSTLYADLNATQDILTQLGAEEVAGQAGLEAVLVGTGISVEQRLGTEPSLATKLAAADATMATLKAALGYEAFPPDWLDGTTGSDTALFTNNLLEQVYEIADGLGGAQHKLRTATGVTQEQQDGTEPSLATKLIELESNLNMLGPALDPGLLATKVRELEARVRELQAQQPIRIYSPTRSASAISAGQWLEWVLPYEGWVTDVQVYLRDEYGDVRILTNAEVEMSQSRNFYDRSFTSAFDTNGVINTCRYLRIHNDSDTAAGLAFTQVQVRGQDGTDYAAGATVTASTPAFTNPGMPTGGSGGHLAFAAGGQPLFWEVDLGVERTVDSVLVFGAPGYNASAQVELLNSSRGLLWSRAASQLVNRWTVIGRDTVGATVRPYSLYFRHGATLTVMNEDGTLRDVRGEGGPWNVFLGCTMVPDNRLRIEGTIKAAGS